METTKFTYNYPAHYVASDSVVFGFDGKEMYILLIERGNEPFKGMWALPGGFMKPDETIEQCAVRELKEETDVSVKQEDIRQFNVYSQLDRDPRYRVMSVSFYALVVKQTVKGGDDANGAAWFPVKQLPDLAFDHDIIINDAMSQLKKDIYFKPIGFELLPKKFTVSQLQKLYELILDTKLDRRNFAKKVRDNLKIIKEVRTNTKDMITTANTTKYYSFDEKRYSDLKSGEIKIEF